MTRNSHFVLSILASIFLITCTLSSNAEEFPRGALIFQEGTGEEAKALALATGSRLTHVGIIRHTGTGPFVIEASAENGVWEDPIEDFIAKGKGKHYAIYEVQGVETPKDWYHPLVLAVYDYLGSPYDFHYRAEEDAFYNAELIYNGARKLGISLAEPQRIQDLSARNPKVQSFFLSHWKDDPECKAAKLGRAACWNVIGNRSIVTAASIAKSPRLRLIKSTFR